jgi:hypothetical protein
MCKGCYFLTKTRLQIQGERNVEGEAAVIQKRGMVRTVVGIGNINY